MSSSSSHDRKVKCFIAVALFLIVSCAVIVPVMLLFETSSKTIFPEGGLHRLACPRHRNTTIFSQEECTRLGCTWNETRNAPPCYLPEQNNYVVMNTLSENEQGFSVRLQKVSSYSFFHEPVEYVVFQVFYVDEYQLNFRISQEGKPLQDAGSATNKLFDSTEAVYTVDINRSEGSVFNFKILRSDGHRTLWDTSIGGLIVESQFLQIATYLPSKNIYGLGESSDSGFRRTLGYKTWPMLIRKESPGDEGLNLYGFNPFYLCLEEDGRAHGVLFNNLFVSDYTLLAAPGLSLRAVGGELSFSVIVGQTPADVYRKLNNIVGRPGMPPYWALGFHLAPFHSIQAVVERNLEKEVLLDAVHLDPDLWPHRDVFREDELTSSLVAFIKQNSQLHWVVTVDPAVHVNEKYSAYQSGVRNDAFIKWPPEISTEIMFGNRFFNRGNESVAFPDLMTEKSQNWWKNLVQKLTNSLKLDGFLTTVNEPCEHRSWEKDSSGNIDSCWQRSCPMNNVDYPQYRPGFADDGNIGSESNKTVCMAGVHGDGRRHLEVHGSYGMLLTAVTHQGCSVRNERCLVITRSTSMVARMLAKSGLRDHMTSVGRWLGNNKSQWDDMHKSVIGMLESNLFGVPYVGADICGYEGTASNDLCKAWIQLGAMYPFARMRYAKLIQNGVVSMQERSPASLTSLLDTARQSLIMRYFLLPYMYTVFYHVHTEGGAVIRPLFYEFPKDNITWNIDKQFMWGPGLMIAPVLNQGEPSPTYFPKDVWYRFQKEQSRVTVYSGEFRKIYDTSTLPMYVRGGKILPLQEPIQTNSQNSRRGPLALGVFHKDLESTGSLYWDDGVSKDAISSGRYYYFTFSHRECQLTIKRTHANGTLKNQLLLNRIYVYNVGRAEKVTVDGIPEVQPSYDDNFHYATLKVNIPLTETTGSKEWTISWCATINPSSGASG